MKLSIPAQVDRRRTVAVPFRFRHCPPPYRRRRRLSWRSAEAQRLGLTPEDLARAIIVDLLAGPGEDFSAAAARVLKKNEELYRRLG